MLPAIAAVIRSTRHCPQSKHRVRSHRYRIPSMTSRVDSTYRSRLVELHTRHGLKGSPSSTVRDNDKIMDAFGRAFDAGCTDPLVTMFYVSRYRLQSGCNRERTMELMNRAVEKMTADRFPAFRSAAALICRAAVARDLEGGGSARPSPAGLRQINQDLDLALRLPCRRPWHHP